MIIVFLEEEKEIDYGISNSSYRYLRNQCRDMAYIIERWLSVSRGLLTQHLWRKTFSDLSLGHTGGQEEVPT